MTEALENRVELLTLLNKSVASEENHLRTFKEMLE